MSLNTDIFYQHLSATINRVWLYYQHPIKTTPCRNPATTSQTTPIFLPINFQYNPTPTTSHTSTNPSNIQYHCTTHISLIHITNFKCTVSSTTPRYTLPQRLVFLELFSLFLYTLEKLPLCPCANKSSKTIHCLKTYLADRQQFLMINKLGAERKLLLQFSLFCPLFSAVLLMRLFKVFILCINEP